MLYVKVLNIYGINKYSPMKETGKESHVFKCFKNNFIFMLILCAKWLAATIISTNLI